ncbi:MAG: DUF2946 family protein, partial [Hydrogenophaga sp.]
APTLAHAWVAAADEGQWIEVCSTSGMVWLKADGSDANAQNPEPSAPMGDMGQHCPWCSFHGASADLPPTLAAPHPMLLVASATPPWAEALAHGQAIRSAAARGPPLTS